MVSSFPRLIWQAAHTIKTVLPCYKGSVSATHAKYPTVSPQGAETGRYSALGHPMVVLTDAPLINKTLHTALYYGLNTGLDKNSKFHSAHLHMICTSKGWQNGKNGDVTSQRQLN